MRPALSLLLFLAAWCLPTFALAQGDKKYLPPEIKKIDVGFRAAQPMEPSLYKVGLWAPVHVEVFGGSEGIELNPAKPPHVIIETVDSEDVGTQIKFPVAVPPMETRSFTGYVKTGHMAQGQEIRIILNVNDRKFEPRTVEQYRSVNVHEHLYVTLGSKIPDLHQAVQKMIRRGDDKDQPFGNRDDLNPRHSAYESDVTRLPEYWFGYNGVDLLILSTERRDFLNELRNQPEKLKALAAWVRRGGRLVIPVASQNQQDVAALLKEEQAWQPPIPVVPPAAAGKDQEYSVKRLGRVESWGNVEGHPFQRLDPNNPQLLLPIPIARLDPDKKGSFLEWEVWADSGDGTDSRPLIARVRYGLGQIIYFAFSFEDPYFVDWSGKEQFFKRMMTRLAPRAPDDNRNWDINMNRAVPDDLTTNLLGQLDTFDVTAIPFGYVALFIILYILVVGPLDFFLLKYVFKRLEWTWITFPTVVLAVSVLAYFAAYALKGQDLKINKVDIVDFDLRTDLNANGEPRSAHAYGQTFLTILSPRIQNYTIGLEPNPGFWGEGVGKTIVDGNQTDKVLSVDLMSWMGRPSGGPHDMGRSGSSGFFRKPYTFRDDASGLEGVPIPVWTTKAFAASWEQKLSRLPFQVDLVYHQKEVKGQELKITGKLGNHLGVDLVDVWLLYDDRCFAIPEGLKSVKQGDVPQAISIAVHPSTDVKSWANQGGQAGDVPEDRAWSSNPESLVKQLLFHERIDPSNSIRNHLLRPLDLGWRMQEERRDQRDRHTREAILFARVRFLGGRAEKLTLDHPLATKLWLGDFPESGKTRPELNGHLNQDTYVRVLLPVRPAEE